MPSIRRSLDVCLVVALAAATVLAPAASAAADGVTEPTLDVRNGAGQPASEVAVNDPLSVTESAPIAQVGQTDQLIQSTWDPAQLAVDADSIVQPEGWDLEYTTDGSTWGSSVPSPATDIRGVRSSGSVASNGLAGGLQVSTASGTGDLQAGTGSFTGSSGGDGWDAFVVGDDVLNVWHHNSSSYNLDCHDKTSGSSCGSVYSVSGYRTGPGSSGSTVGNKVYSLVGKTSTSEYGILCTDVSAVPFSSCGFTALLTSSGGFNLYKMGTQSLSGTKIYAPVTDNSGKLLCYDTSTSSACAGQPYSLAGISARPAIPAFSAADSGDVFVLANKVWCFDGATGAACSGSWPVGSFSGSVNGPAPMRDTDGTLTGVCLLSPVGNCFDLTGASATFPSALSTLLNAAPADVNWQQFGFSGTRQYWISSSTGPGYPQCWDWTTQAACAGFATDVSTGTSRYALRLDPTNQNCIWTNGDNGQISSFDAFTGAAGCPGPDPTVVVPYSTAVPRMSCAESGRVLAYLDLTLTTPAGVSVTALDVTVDDSDGDPVAGFVGLHPDAGGVIDLSGLGVDDTGTRPSFEITSPSTSTIDAKAITAALRYESDPPQLCMTLNVRQDCPTLEAGISPASSVPVADMTIDGQTVATAGGVGTPTPLSAMVTRADMPGCLGTVSGTASRTFPGGSVPLEGATVNLVGPDSSVIASTTTASDGTYSFENVNPAAYTVTLGDQSEDGTVTAAETTTADFSVAVEDPTAQNVNSATLQNRPVTFAISATSDPSTTIDLTTVQLQDPDTLSWGTSVTVDGQGTWTVTDDGDLTFTPEPGFVGTTDGVRYRVADGYGTTASAEAQVEVSESLPTASPVEVTGVRGDTLSITPNGVGPTVPLVDASLKLVDPSDGSRVTSLTVDGVGTFEVDATTGKVVFTPLGTFTGSATVIYQVIDELDRTAISTMRVTLNQIDVEAGHKTVDIEEPANLGVFGVPPDSTVTAPSTVAGAASVGLDGARVLVVPAAGFTGTITVPVTVTHGTATLGADAIVYVRPAPVTGGSHHLVDAHTTTVRWTGSEGARWYEIHVNGVLRCRTVRTSCTMPRLLGPAADIQVTAVGADSLRSEAVRVPYHETACHGLGTVYFDTASARLRADARATLDRLDRKLAAQGFTLGCLVGHTDNRGSVAYNLALSRHRVASVAAYVHDHVRGLRLVGHYHGELIPAAPNNTPAGRAANRRVELGVN